MTKTLLAITTANQLEYTKLCLDSLKQVDLSKIDVVIFDDASKDGTIEFCKRNNIGVVAKERSQGLTHSWNLAYAHYKKYSYDYLIIANNDVLIPPGALDILLSGLANYAIVGPLSTRKGVHHQPLQAFDEYYSIDFDHTVAENYQKVQEYLQQDNSDNAFVELPFLNGFFFACNKQVIKYEHSPTELFNPSNINIANEDELCRKVNEKKAVCVKAFIFHFKGVSFKDFTLSSGYLLSRNLTWEEAQELNRGGLKFQAYRILQKIKQLF
jgi:O-antigen biosynthesis protein